MGFVCFALWEVPTDPLKIWHSSNIGGMTVTNQNLIHDEIESTLNLGNAFHHSVQNLLSPHLLSKTVKIRIYRTIILPVVLNGYETLSLTLRKAHN
jgi:hypothetical protein